MSPYFSCGDSGVVPAILLSGDFTDNGCATGLGMAYRKHVRVAEVLAITDECGGIIGDMAEQLGCSRTIIHNMALRNKRVQEAISQAQEATKDLAERKMREKIEAGHWPALRYYLSTKCRDRGYGNFQEIAGAMRVSLGWSEEHDGGVASFDTNS